MLYKDTQVGAAMNAYSILLNKVIQLANTCEDANVRDSLTHLPVFGFNSRLSNWQIYAELFLKLLIQRDLVHDWHLNKAQIDRFKNYLVFSELLVSCLKVAVVSDRQAILAQVLAPPRNKP